MFYYRRYMYEPKYKLNKKDDARWHELLTRHCCELPAASGDAAKRSKKFPPLTQIENEEFERLTRKRDRRVESHPKVRASLRRQKETDQKLRHLLMDLKKLSINVDEFM